MDRSYVLKNWVTVLCAGPVLLMLYELVFGLSENAIGYLETALLFIIFGSIFSLPALLIYYLLFVLLSRKLINAGLAKWILTLICVLSIIITFGLMQGALSKPFTLAYCMAAVLSGACHRIRKREERVV